MRHYFFFVTMIMMTIQFSSFGSQLVARTKIGADATRLRVIMSSDFPPIGVVKGGDVPNDQKSDPDDMQSMVRFLLYANEFDIEALIASSGTFANIARKQNILEMIDRYEMVYENLRKHDPIYPAAEALRAITFQGRSGTWGKSVSNNIGAGKDSEASEAIIAIIDKADPRPVYIGVWGDCSNIAQAVWKVQKTRSPAELETFLGKMRIHQIGHQDDTIDWLMDNFPGLFIIYSNRTYQGMFGGSDPISNLAWVNEHIRFNHGPLCAVYPHEGIGCTGVCEGDSPSFLWLVSANRGLNDPDDPTQPSWGGQFRRDGTTSHFVDGPGGSSISRWRPDYQAEFQQRADWCLDETVDETGCEKRPKGFKLGQNDPNPFHPRTTRKYDEEQYENCFFLSVHFIGTGLSSICAGNPTETTDYQHDRPRR
ncbi:DUF1593 domain-containing protein [candidate division KSB1 bacterium]|nr:DUF1593 domain-containing protein [candidate division KSB1 bacterium]